MKSELRRRLSKTEGRLRREGRRLASVFLCGALIVGNLSAVPVSVLADDDNDYTYEIEKTALQEALQTAVSEGNTVNEDLEFAGEHAEEYAELLEADGTLYELELSDEEIDEDDDRDKALDLRIFARIEGDIPVDEAYEIDGSEEIVFLLSNKTEKTATATISIDGLETEVITILPVDSIAVEEESTAVESTALTATVSRSVSSGGSGGGSGSSSASASEEAAETESTEEEAVIEIINEADDDAAESASITEDTEVTVVPEEDDSDDSIVANDITTEEDNVSAEDPAEEENGSSDQKEAGDPVENAEDENKDTENINDADTDGDIDDTGTEETDNKDSDTVTDTKTEGDTDSSSNTENADDNRTSDTDTTSSNNDAGDVSGDDNSTDDNTSDGGSSSGNAEDTSDNGNDSDITEDSEVSVDVLSSAISIHKSVLLAASKATDSDADETASVSDADNAVDGIVYESVRFDKKGVAAFATTAADLKLDEIEETESEESVEYTAEADGVSVTVTAPEGALPEDAVLSVTVYEEDSVEYTVAAEVIDYDYTAEETAKVDADADSSGDAVETASEEVVNDTSTASTGLVVLDISFLVDGEEVEPTEAVIVSIDASGIVPEDADASTIEVQHLTNNGDEVEATLVADATDETDGTVDAESVVAEFEVESFSSFTITWKYGNFDNDSASITLNVYDADTGDLISSGTDLISTTIFSTTNGGSLSISALTETLTVTGYDYSYATVTYGNSTVGSESESVISISKNGGPNGSYTITYGSSTQTADSITSINLYYIASGPSVSISAEATDTGYNLTATPSGFDEDAKVTYTWSVSDLSIASIEGDGVSATLTWADGVSNGASVTVTVTADDGTNTVTDTYTVYYGVTNVTFTVVYPTGSSGATAVASGVTVTVKDANGDTVATETTDSKGQVTLQLSNGATYTVETSDYETSNYTYSFSGSVTADATNGNIISLVRASGSYEHIDIKYVAVSSGTTTQSLSGVTSVYLYDSNGNLVNYTTSIGTNSTEQNWQTFWNTNTGNNGHSISFSTDYTVVITYTVYDSSDQSTETYTATIDSTTTYPEGSYYPVTGACAYQLYNYIYGTNYNSSNWASSDVYKELADTGINVSGMTYFEVAIVLCDSWGASQNGLDFALDVQSLLYLSAGWDFEVKKIYENNSMTGGDFTFNLYNASCVDEIWTFGDLLQSQTNDAATAESNGNSQNTISFTQLNYSTSDAGTYYYIITETQGDSNEVTYDNTIYGVQVVVNVTPGTSRNVTTYTTTVVASYYKLTAEIDDDGNITGYKADEITLNTSTDGLIVFPFTNVYSEGTSEIIIKKVDENGNDLSGATFTLKNDSSDEYYSIADETESWNNVEEGNTAPTISLGTATIALSDGKYILTETSAPDGYNLLSDGITIVVSDGKVERATYGDGTNASVVTLSSDGLTVTVKNTAGSVLPETGGPGTIQFRIAGLLLMSVSAYLIYDTLKRRRIFAS